MAFIYWIHLPSHTDIFTQGYIGFTSKTVPFRFQQHNVLARSGHKSRLYNAMRKHAEEIIISTLVEGEDFYCLELEGKLRPTTKIGWNSGKGGENTMKGFIHSDEVKIKMSDASPTKGKKLDPEYVKSRAERRRSLKLKHSPEAIEKMSQARLNLKLKPWQNPAANLDVWIHAQKIYEYAVENPEKGAYICQKDLGFGPNELVSMYKHIRKGWVPNQDTTYLEWLESYKLKEGNYGT